MEVEGVWQLGQIVDDASSSGNISNLPPVSLQRVIFTSFEA